MNLISTHDLKEKIDSGISFKLVMVLDAWQFDAKHIPGSINISSPAAAKKADFDQREDIVVYCSSDSCPASIIAYKALEAAGFINVARYSGGLSEWENAGLPLVGEMV